MTGHSRAPPRLPKNLSMSPASASSRRTYARALREVRSYWPHLGIVLTLGLVGAPLALLTPLPLKLVADSVLGSAALPWPLDQLADPGEAALVLAIALSAVLVLLHLAHTVGEWLFREWVSERMIARFRAKLFERAMLVATPGQAASATQDLACRISNDAPSSGRRSTASSPSSSR